MKPPEDVGERMVNLGGLSSYVTECLCVTALAMRPARGERIFCHDPLWTGARHTVPVRTLCAAGLVPFPRRGRCDQWVGGPAVRKASTRALSPGGGHPGARRTGGSHACGPRRARE
jgi:hypothetical protein